MLLTGASAHQPIWPPPHAGTLCRVACQDISSALQGQCCMGGSWSCAWLPLPRSCAAGLPGVSVLVTRLSSV